MDTRRVDVDGVARRLVHLRAAAIWSVEQTAEKAGVTVAQVKRAENGVFSLLTLARLNDAYGSNLDWLAFEEGPVYRKEGGYTSE